MRSKLFIAMPVILLMLLLAYPILKVSGIIEGSNADKYSVEIVQTATKADKSVCRWGLSRGKNGAIPEAGKDDVEILLKGGGMYLGDINENRMYLTFDEGYENGYTEAILDTLKEENVKAIFFITGDYFEKNDAIIRRMLAEGHSVGNHSLNHYSMPELSYDKCESEILELDRLFYNKFGQHMSFFRPPKGEYNAQVLDITKKLNYKCVMWSFAYQDWLTDSQKGADYALKTVSDNFHDGAIILLHAVSKDNADALSAIIREARKQGYEFGEPEELK
ncbi:MAG: polysaccharide deacetylase [Ruminococcaceae bacterium]|nr:polysaccharide deacetylase [Oscillospiraceae bacterium]